MKKLLIFSLLATILCSCNSEKAKEKKSPQDSVVVENENHKNMYGIWMGKFEKNPDDGDFDEIGDKVSYKLTIIIKRITADSVYAQSIRESKTSALTGKIEDNGKILSFVLNEDGKSDVDGHYDFKFENDKLQGKFIPFDKDDTYNLRKFQLVKKPFEYNANLMLLDDSTAYVDWSKSKSQRNIIKNDDGTSDTSENNNFRSASKRIFKINASTTALKESELKNLRKLDLEIIRNTIFARHGYAFKKETFRNFFDPVEWYVPVADDVNAVLTNVEKTNIILLQRFEKYAVDNYDTFGR